MDICLLDRRGLENIHHSQVDHILTWLELKHILDTFGAIHRFLGERLPDGSTLPHVLLASGYHSDIVVDMEKVFEHPNLLDLLAHQIVLCMRGVAKKEIIMHPDMFIAGVPNGAINLGKVVADIIGVHFLPLEKDSRGVFRVVGDEALPDGVPVLLIDDVGTFCTSADKAARAILGRFPGVRIMPYEAMVLNRGQSALRTMANQMCRIISVVHKPLPIWAPCKDECPHCRAGSRAMKLEDMSREVLVAARNG